jgi:hypothetical protein
MMKAVHTSEISVYYKDTRPYIPDGCNLHDTKRLKSTGDGAPDLPIPILNLSKALITTGMK